MEENKLKDVIVSRFKEANFQIHEATVEGIEFLIATHPGLIFSSSMDSRFKYFFYFYIGVFEKVTGPEVGELLEILRKHAGKNQKTYYGKKGNTNLLLLCISSNIEESAIPFILDYKKSRRGVRLPVFFDSNKKEVIHPRDLSGTGFDAVYRIMLLIIQTYIKLEMEDRKSIFKPEIYAGVAQSPKMISVHPDLHPDKVPLSDAEIEACLSYNNKHLNVALLARDDFPKGALGVMVENKDEIVRMAVALRKGLSSDIINKLASDPKEKVKMFLAQNPEISKDVMEDLSNLKKEKIRIMLASNENLPKELMDKLASDEKIKVRAQIASRTDLPDDIIEKLSNDKKKPVKKALEEMLAKR